MVINNFIHRIEDDEARQFEFDASEFTEDISDASYDRVKILL